MTSRDDAKQLTRQRIVGAAGDCLRDMGAGQVSLREVARRVGVAPSAVYRHFDSRDALLTELLLLAYRDLAGRLHREPRSGGSAWTRRADVLRAWARDSPRDFQLLYGTPVVGYAAPVDTVGPAADVAASFVELVTDPPAVPEALARQLEEPAAGMGCSAAALAWTLASLSHLVGMLSLELDGHLVGTAEPADELWHWIVANQQRCAS